MNLIEEATIFALKAHEGQKRKLTGIPYIIHAMEVASVAATLTNDHDVIAAALLHDTIEDCGVSKELIITQFGERVAEIVLSETENKYPDMPKEQSWMIRKAESLEVLRKSDDIAVKILWLSDKVSNARSLYEAYKREGDGAFNHFHQKNKKEHERYYRLIGEYTRMLENTSAHKEYMELINKIFGGEQ